jgi:hypothetical protein
MNDETAVALLAQFAAAVEEDDDIDVDDMEDVIAAVPPPSSTRGGSTGLFYDAVAAQNVRTICDDYVAKFMADSNCIADLRESLHACHQTLAHMDGVLETFASALVGLQSDMCGLKSRAEKSTAALDHAKSVHTVVQSVVSHLVVPPDVVLVIIGTGTDELGPQFLCSIRKLHKLLRSRSGRWAQPKSQSSPKGLCSHAPPPVSGSVKSLVVRKLLGTVGAKLPVSHRSSECTNVALEAHAVLQRELHHRHSHDDPTSDDIVAKFILSFFPDWTTAVTSGDDTMAPAFFDWLLDPPQEPGHDLRAAFFGDGGGIFPVPLSQLLGAVDTILAQDRASMTNVAVACGCQPSHLDDWHESYGDRQRKCTPKLLGWLNDARYHVFRPTGEGGAGIQYETATKRGVETFRVVLQWLREKEVAVDDIRAAQVGWVHLLHEWFAHKGQRHASSAGEPFARWLNTLQEGQLQLSPSRSSDSLASVGDEAAMLTAGSPKESRRTVEIHLNDCKAFREVHRIVDDLTVFACEKIRTFLVGRLTAVLRRQRTNISVQQDNVLRPYAPLVFFLRQCAPYLKIRENGGAPNENQLPFRTVRALYAELRAQYISIVSEIYFSKISTYITRCNALEGIETSATSSWGFFGGRAAATPRLTQPLLTDPSGLVGPSNFSIGNRGEVFCHMFDTPVIPHVNAARGAKHSYAETFRSVNLLLADAVTQEYLFTMDFFAGDVTVYAAVFQPVVQHLVDYVCEVLLQIQPLRSQQAQPMHRPGAVFAACNQDACGLLALIRQCHIFRYLMSKTRRLTCLDGYYDSLLMLLWPAFKDAFELQLAAMKGLNEKQVLAFVLNMLGASLPEKYGAVHPITLRYAEFTAALMALGTLVEPSSPAGLGCSAERFNESYVSDGLWPGDRQRVRSIVEQNDRAESVSRFAVLQSNLAFLRVEFLRIISIATEELGKLVAQQQKAPDMLCFGEKISAIVLLNNVFHVLAVWRSTKVPPTGLSADVSPPCRSDSEGFDFGEGSVPPASAPATDLTASPDFAALLEVLNAARAQFVEQALRAVFPSLVALASEDGDAVFDDERRPATVPAAVLAVARDFARQWREGVTALHRDVVLRFVPHPDCQRECLVALSSQLLLYNTRLHRAMAAACEREKASNPAVESLFAAETLPLPVLMHFVRSVFRV